MGTRESRARRRAIRVKERAKGVRCSFCEKEQSQVAHIIVGPGVFICDECVAVCNEIIAELKAEAAES